MPCEDLGVVRWLRAASEDGPFAFDLDRNDDGPGHGAWDVLEFDLLVPSPGHSLVALVSTPPRATAVPLMDEIEARMCIPVPLQTPILRDAPRLRKSRTPATVISIMRSTRLVAKPRALNATLQAQAVLMQKLGLPVDTPPADLEALERYIDTFRAPLTPSKLEALQTLFSPDFDLVAGTSTWLSSGRETCSPVPGTCFVAQAVA